MPQKSGSITIWLIRKKNTIRAYQSLIVRFCHEYGDFEIDQVTSDDVLTFLNRLTENNKPCTKRVRYTHLSSFFNFVRDGIDPGLGNPCNSPLIRKLYRVRVASKPRKSVTKLHKF